MTQPSASAMRLYELARSGQSTDREALLQGMTGLLHAELTAHERELAHEILLLLLREAEMDLRESLAQQLALEPTCPKALLDFLVYDNPLSVSKPVLQHSTVFTDDDMIEIAKHFDSVDYCRVIALRPQIGEKLAMFLIGADDEDTYLNLLDNKGAQLGSISINWLTSIAIHAPALQSPLLLRPEVTPELAVRLYWHVSDHLRQQILSRFEIPAEKLDKALEYTVAHRKEQKHSVEDISAETLDLSFKMKQQGRITSRQIMDALRKNDVLFFTSLWASLFELKPQRLFEMLKTQPMTTLATLCRAAQMTKADYNTLFLLWRRQGTPSITNATELGQAMAVFNEMKMEDAQLEIEAWKNAAQSTARH